MVPVQLFTQNRNGDGNATPLIAGNGAAEQELRQDQKKDRWVSPGSARHCNTVVSCNPT